MKTFFRGTVLLIFAAFFSECVEFFVNVVLAKELGERGMGLYMTILPSIFLVFLLSSFEMPISISKFVAEKDPRYHHNMLQHAIKFSIIFTSLLFIAAMVILPFIHVFDEYDPRIRWLIIILIPMISFSAIARGYFMGLNAMSKIAIANFLRRILQLLLLVTVFQLYDFSLDTSIFIALSALVGSEFVVFLYLIHMFFLQFRLLKDRFNHQSISGRAVRKSLMAVSIPTTALRIFNAVTNAIQPFLIKAALVHSGLTENVATEQFGLLAGIAMTIGFFPAFIAHSLLIALIPAVSKAYADHDYQTLQRLLHNVLIVTFIYGTIAVTIFYFYADQLTNLFFHSNAAAWYLQMLWPYFLLHFFVIPMQAYLIGLGLIKDAFLHTVWATIIEFSLMYFLGSAYQFQMGGVIIGLNCGIVLLTAMHYLTICKKIDYAFIFRKSIKNTYY